MSEEQAGAEDFAARTAELERKLAEVEEAAHGRIVRAELKAAAVRAGMVDLDGIKLLDTGGIKLNAAGEIEGAAALMRDLRKAKPWLFGGASSSSTAAAPGPRAPENKLATAMTFDEWQAARRELLKRR
jgi:hypothetical protein